MTTQRRISIALCSLRISIFIVMLMWTLDKFIRPEHAAAVFEKYYFIASLGQALTWTLGGLELVLLIGFLLGIAKRMTYGAVLVLHGVSTLSSFNHYITPFGEGPHLLFFAAWPMLAACFTLYLLRDLDTLVTYHVKTLQN